MGILDTLKTGILGDPGVQATGIATAIGMATGITPKVVYDSYGNAEVNFTPEQENQVVAYLNAALSKPSGPPPVDATGQRKPSVSINAKMILLRVFLKNYWYLLGGPFVGGFLTGRRSKR